MAEIRIENIVGSFQIAPSLDLLTLASVFHDATYNPTDVPAVILSFKKPKAVAMLFSTGNVILTGANSMEEVDELIKMINDRLAVAGVQGEANPSIKIQNIVASLDYNTPLDLRSIAKAFHNTEYDPNNFPGLVYKTDDPNTVILLFDSGKVVCNGPTKEAVSSALNTMMEKLLTIGIKKEENVCQK